MDAQTIATKLPQKARPKTSSAVMSPWHVAEREMHFPIAWAFVAAWQGPVAGRILRVLRRLGRFDPRRGTLLTFIRHLVKRSASHILRGQRSLKRAGTLGALSIDGTVLNVHGKSIPIGETVSEEDGRRRTGARPTSGIEQLERSEAIAHAYCALSLSERDVWSLLTRRTRTAAAREMATSRRHVRNIMAVIRCQLESAGLRNSWKN